MRAIPLKRPRATASRPGSVSPLRWQDRLTRGMPVALAAPRQVWLATLGAATLAVRAATATWTRLVDEGLGAETRLRALRGGE